jgi:hypothetical protein
MANEMDPSNPFAAPQSTSWAGPPGPATPGSITSPGIVEALRATRPWVMFLGVLGFIFGALVLIGAVVIFFRGMAARQPAGGLPMTIMAVIYVLIGVIQVAAAYYLFGYGQRIGDFLAGGHVQSLTEALNAQKSFWRLIGIVALVYLLVLALIFVVSIAVGTFQR